MNPLFCPRCVEYRFIRFKLIRFGKMPRAFTIRMPFYECDYCEMPPESIIPFDGERLVNFRDYLLANIPPGPLVEVPFKQLIAETDITAKFKRYDYLGFDYDPFDFYFIPGLYREFDTGYLTPVFFEKDLLVYYNNHPDYSVLLYSFSSGSIYCRGKSILNYGFGINRSGRLFTWLGDLDQDLGSERMIKDLKRFQASNIGSDHDVVSTFYTSQNPFTEEDVFPDSDNEVRVFQLKNLFDECIKTLFNVQISKVNVERLPDYYRTPILNDREQILDAYMKLDQYLIETIQKPELKAILIQKGVENKDINDLGGIKLLERFTETALEVPPSPTLFSPLYVLHDLRNLKGHLSDKSYVDKYNSCKQRLNVPLATTDYSFFVLVVQRLIDFYQHLSDAAKRYQTK